MVRYLFFIAAFCGPLFLTPAWAADDSPLPLKAEEQIPGQVLVCIEEGVSPAEVEQIAESIHAKVERRLTSWGLYLFSFDHARPVAEVVKELSKQPGVKYAEPNFKVSVNVIDTETSTSTSLTAGDPSSRIVVAVLDTGLDMTHPAFSGSIYTNPGEIPGNGIDDDKNGFVDDVHGWDFYDWDNQPAGEPGFGDHGTMVAGRVLQGASNIGISILPLRVGPGPWLDLGAIVAALDYAVAQGARVINMSFGAGIPFQVLTEAIARAAEKGVLLVAAAGNNGSDLPSYPAAYPVVVSVAATDAWGKKASWSNYGSTVDFSAPGENVTTTAFGGGTTTVSGTSFAAPFVAGVLARILAALPNITPGQAIDRLKTFAKDINALNPAFRGLLGAGWVDAQVAQEVHNAYPIATEPKPTQPNSDLKAKLESELAQAKEEVARLEKELAEADQALAAAEEARAAAQAAVSRETERVQQAWIELIGAWWQWYRSFFRGTSAQREAARQRLNEARDKWFEAMAALREAQARLRVAQNDENRARERRNKVALALKAAQDHVKDLEQRLGQLGAPIFSQSRKGPLSSNPHRSEIERLIQQLRLFESNRTRPELPEGVKEVPNLLLSGDDRKGNRS